MIPASKRPRFLLDLAEELTWLNQNAGPEVAERWYQALKKTICFLQQNPFVGRERTDLKPEGIRSWRINQSARAGEEYESHCFKNGIVVRATTLKN